MTNHGIMEEANYCQLMTELAYVCELSCESYVSQIYMEDATVDVIFESGEKILDTLTTFVRKSLQAAIDHIRDMITKIRIKFSKKKLEKLMSPEIKKRWREFVPVKRLFLQTFQKWFLRRRSMKPF